MRKLKNRVRNYLWVLLKAKWKLRSGIDIRVENDSDWYIYNEIFTNKEYDPAFKLLSQPAQSAIILDLGANVGYFTLKMADELITAGTRDFKIIAIEATTENYLVLENRISQLAKDKAIAYHGLVGYRSGTGNIVFSSQHYGHAAASGQQGEPADYINIEGLLDDTQRIALLKCDIEGSEETFLKEYPGLLLRTDHAVFEFHTNECDILNCRQLLKNAGLTTRGIIKEDRKYGTIVEVFSR